MLRKINGLLALVLGIGLALSGCTATPEYHGQAVDKELMVTQAIDYMWERYQVRVEIPAEPTPVTGLTGKTSFLLTGYVRDFSSAHGFAAIRVQPFYGKSSWDNFEFSDDYLYKRAADDIRKAITEPVRGILPEALITVSVDNLGEHYPETFDGHTTTPELISWITDSDEGETDIGPGIYLNVLIDETRQPSEEILVELANSVLGALDWWADPNIEVETTLTVSTYSVTDFVTLVEYQSLPFDDPRFATADRPIIFPIAEMKVF
ncbi:MAG: hypothetical protein FWG15_02965 [Propionibacteriaceae bacterium]|nr:hypothetical protein [Propionibacteriaceae bacterium]